MCGLQEYERAVIFRLGRLVTGGARGPGVFFIIPCVDVYEKIDMRTTTYEIPPQEVRIIVLIPTLPFKWQMNGSHVTGVKLVVKYFFRIIFVICIPLWRHGRRIHSIHSAIHI